MEEYDIYATPSGNVIARYGNSGVDFVRATGGMARADPSNAENWKRGMARLRPGKVDEDIAERIAAMTACFAPDLCGAHNNKGE